MVPTLSSNITFFMELLDLSAFLGYRKEKINEYVHDK